MTNKIKVKLKAKAQGISENTFAAVLASNQIRGPEKKTITNLFKDQSVNVPSGYPVCAVVIYNLKEQTFEFIYKGVPTSFLILESIKNNSFNKDDIKKIIELKQDILSGMTEEACIKIILGVANSLVQFREFAKKNEVFRG